jgi:hypothetical protein
MPNTTRTPRKPAVRYEPLSPGAKARLDRTLTKMGLR